MISFNILKYKISWKIFLFNLSPFKEKYYWVAAANAKEALQKAMKKYNLNSENVKIVQGILLLLLFYWNLFFKSNTVCCYYFNCLFKDLCSYILLNVYESLAVCS